MIDMKTLRERVIEFHRKQPTATVREIAKELDCSHNAVWLVLNEEGLIGRTEVSEAVAAILELGGLSQTDLALILGSSPAQVSRWKGDQQANRQDAHRLNLLLNALRHAKGEKP